MTELHPHPVPPRAPRLRLRRQHLLVGCAFGAASLFMGHADRASAQAFQLNDANPTQVAGSISRVTGAQTETITVNSSTAIINWNRAEADFLPENHIATFQNGGGQTDFVVLNRVLALDTGNPIQFNGTVRSQINGTPGGTVLFQSASGIIVGPTAVFDVGNLVLTTLNVVDETGYGDIVNDGGGFDFNFAPQFDSEIVIEEGARINALANGSYVVMAAPRIDQGGTVRVNGSAAYIGAYSATFSINAGLFDIVVTNGSDLDTPIEHSGSTLWPNSAGPADPRRIYMATRTSFDPITMLLSGNMGADAATGATVENGQIVLSAGFDIANGAIVDDIDRNDNSTYKYSEANIRITGGTFTADVVGRATQDAIAVSDDGALSFSGDLNLVAYNNAELGATNADVSVAGAVGLTSLGALEFGYGGSSALAIVGPQALDVTGSDVSITAEDGHTVVIAGDATLEASAVGDFDDVDDLDAGFGRGGNIRVEVDSTGGQITFQSDLAMNATGTGAADSRTPDTGGDGFGGSATIRALAGEIVVDGGVAIDLRGTGTGGATSAGGGFGGDASISAAGGNVRIAGATTIDTRGTGGAILGTPAGGTVGGEGRGGDVSLIAETDSGVIQLGNISVSSVGTGGTGFDGGAGTGGDVFAGTEVGYGGGGIPSNAAFGNLDFVADGTGGTGSRNGGAGTGGSALVGAQAGQVSIGGASNLSARGTGGAAGSQAGGAGQGGSVGIRAFSGQTLLASAGSTVLDASGVGGQGGTGLGTGGNGTGGTASIQAFGGTLTLSGSFALSADGTGGVSSPAIPPVGIGGNGQGGTASIQATPGGQITMGATALSAVGTGGDGILGGNGTGGRNEITGISGGRVTAGNVTAAADGVGGDGNNTQNGGAGTGGQVRLVAEADGGAIVLGDVTATARGIGGSASGSGNGGLGDGGDLFAGTELGYGGTGSAATATFGNISLDGSGTGGAGTTGANGVGGSAQVLALVGQVAFGGNLNLVARGAGGAGTGPSAPGGAGTGGTSGVVARNGATVQVTSVGSGLIDSGGTGGNGGGQGGGGTGGTAYFTADGGTITSSSDIAVRADGTGGNGSGVFGGSDGTGGLAQIGSLNGAAVSFGNATVTADGRGGVGVAGGIGRAGNSVDATVSVEGGAFIGARGGTITGGSATVSAQGFGGDSIGAGDPLAGGSDGGDGFGGTTQIIAGNDQTGAPSSISLGSASIDMSAFGGDAAAGYSGGDATAGIVGSIVARTQGNTISAGTVTVNANALGGNAGPASGSLVGNGGNATAGIATIGTISGLGSAPTSGGATFGTVQASASAIGGNGVAAGSNGGSAIGGQLDLLGRGGTLTAGAITMAVNGTGGTAGAGGTGGSGTGGSISALSTTRFQTSDAPTVSIASLTLSADGTGGAAAGGTGGAGAGGRVFAGTQETGYGSIGGSVALGNLAFTANASGGAGATGGAGAGGEIELRAETSAPVTFGSASMIANGTGGAGSSGVGGIGNGGVIQVRAREDSRLSSTAGATSVAALGRGGNGATGGAGFGGLARIFADSADGTGVGAELAFAGAVAADVSGFGGTGAAGAGGDGTGGLAVAFVDGFDDVGATLSFGSIALSSNGTGGAGTTGGVGRAGATADPQEELDSGVFLSAVNGTISGGAAVVSAQGFGGDATSGAGGDGIGGTAQVIPLNSTSGEINDLAPTVVQLTSVGLDISARGGAGGAGSVPAGTAGGRGGNAAAGINGLVLAETLTGALTVSGNVTVAADATGGSGGAGFFGGRGGDGTAGFVQIGSGSGLGSGPTTGSARLDVVQGTANGIGGAGGAGLQGGGNGGIGSGGFLLLSARGGTLDTGNVTFVTDGFGGNAASGGTGGTGTGGLAAALITPRFQTADGATANIGTFTASSTGVGGTGGNGGASQYGRAYVDVAGSTANFAGVSLTTRGSAGPSDPDLAQPVLIRATDGFLGVSGALSVNSAASVDVTADNGTIRAASANIAAPGTILLGASGTGVIEGGAWELDGGTISAFHDGRADNGSTLDLASLIAVGDAIDLGDGTAIRTSESIGLNAGSVAINGLVAAPDIFVSAAFIDIGGAGFVGDSSTTETTFDIQPYSGGPFVVGGQGGGEGPDYALDAAELGRVRSRELEINVPAGLLGSERPVDLVIRDLTLSAPTAATAPNAAAVNNLLITVQAGEGNATGVAQVEGALRLENAGASDSISIVAPGRIQIVNPQGSIRVLGANGLPSGQLGLQSANIWSASQSIIDQLVANPAFAGRDDALGTNGGTTEERGYIEGGEILMRVGSTLFVQNSGTADQFAGITVVQNTLTIEPASSGQIDVFAYGRRINADGTFVVNSPYFREVEFGDRGRYLASAEFNNCTIATGFCSGDVPPGLPVGSEVIEGPVEDTEESVPPPNPDRQEFVDVSFATESLLEEPVTSGGDSGVWDGEDGDCPPGEVCEPGSGGNP